MNTPTAVLLKSGEADRVLRGHPWIYGGSVLRVTGPIQDGDVVQVKDHRRRFLGLGFFNGKSKIQVRLLTGERREINREFWTQRIQAALALRRKHLPAATSFRVVNAESDQLSGLIVDRYEDALVLQITALGMERRKADLVAVLTDLLKPSALWERIDPAARRFEGLETTGSEGASDALVALPAIPSPALASGAGTGLTKVISLNGLQFTVDFSAGHKTGCYLDQQVNYLRVAELAAGARVLDCFCFTGGFALHAARAGAAEVHGLDQSVEAVNAAARNAAANGLAERCSFEAGNVFDWLKAQTTTRAHEQLIPRYDLVILDPPSFTRNRASVPDALRGYKEIHLRALKLLKPGGVLATFCCSHHVDGRMFQEVILEAAFDAHRQLRRIASYSQAPDHPILPAIPETEYLKGFAFETVN